MLYQDTIVELPCSSSDQSNWAKAVTVLNAESPLWPSFTLTASRGNLVPTSIGKAVREMRDRVSIPENPRQFDAGFSLEIVGMKDQKPCQRCMTLGFTRRKVINWVSHHLGTS